MQLLGALLLVCVGLTLGQLPCPPKSFKAETFDVIDFVLSYSFHDALSGLAYYVNANDDGSHLFDFNSGTVYVQEADGSGCYRLQDDDMQLNKDPITLLSKITEEFKYTGNDGITRTGVQVKNGAFTLKNVYVDVPSCESVFFSLTYGDELVAARGFQSHANFTTDDADLIKGALSSFIAADCELRDQ